MLRDLQESLVGNKEEEGWTEDLEFALKAVDRLMESIDVYSRRFLDGWKRPRKKRKKTKQ
jgi:hypothetical protein